MSFRLIYDSWSRLFALKNRGSTPLKFVKRVQIVVDRKLSIGASLFVAPEEVLDRGNARIDRARSGWNRLVLLVSPSLVLLIFRIVQGKSSWRSGFADAADRADVTLVSMSDRAVVNSVAP